MDLGTFHGHGFLPPSIHLPPLLHPVHGVMATALPTMIASAGVTVLHTAVADHVFPLALGST